MRRVDVEGQVIGPWSAGDSREDNLSRKVARGRTRPQNFACGPVNGVEASRAFVVLDDYVTQPGDGCGLVAQQSNNLSGPGVDDLS
jgi:hypothetical protein